VFPFKSMCTFKGVEVPTFVTCSKNGIIASQLITNMWSKMDEYSLFDRSNWSNWSNPFLLCDGQGKTVGGGGRNCMFLDHPELQETKDRAQSINDIYQKQVMDT
jgi:hypothetical protein